MATGIKLKNFSSFVFKLVSITLVVFLCDCLVGVYLLFVKNQLIPEINEGLRNVKISVQAHPYKSYINTPGTMPYEGEVINEYGHRVLSNDQQISTTAKKSNEYRILFLGGSTTFQQWPFYTADLLNRYIKNKTFKVINAGTGGYTSQENCIDLSICGFSYSPDMVIAYLPVNDIYWSSIYSDFKRDYTHMRIPLEIILKTPPFKPHLRIHSYPFLLKLFEVLHYKREFQAYIKKIDMAYYTNKQPIPYPEAPYYRNYDVSYKPTVDAVIENIWNMRLLCEARGVKFILITQKLFQYPYGYVNRNAYSELMDILILKSIEQIILSEKIAGVDILEMQNIFPNKWDTNSIDLVMKNFPDKKLDFSQSLSYDDIHLNQSALYLFSSFVYEYIKDKL